MGVQRGLSGKRWELRTAGVGVGKNHSFQKPVARSPWPGDWREQARALARLPEQDTGPRRPGKEVDSICKAAFKQGGALMGL